MQNEPEWAERNVSEDLQTVLDEVKWVCKHTKENSEDMEMLAAIHEEMRESLSEGAQGQAVDDFEQLEKLVGNLTPFLRTLEDAIKRIDGSIEGLEQDLKENRDLVAEIADDHGTD